MHDVSLELHQQDAHAGLFVPCLSQVKWCDAEVRVFLGCGCFAAVTHAVSLCMCASAATKGCCTGSSQPGTHGRREVGSRFVDEPRAGGRCRLMSLRVRTSLQQALQVNFDGVLKAIWLQLVTAGVPITPLSELPSVSALITAREDVQRALETDINRLQIELQAIQSADEALLVELNSELTAAKAEVVSLKQPKPRGCVQYPRVLVTYQTVAYKTDV